VPRMLAPRSSRRSETPVEPNPERTPRNGTAAGTETARPAALGSAWDSEAWRADAAAAIARAYREEASEGVVHPGL
jgi:hypothetical protein